LGANLVRRLLHDGRAVRVLLRRENTRDAVDGLDVEMRFGDLRDADAVAAAVQGVERVYHCAAKVSTSAGHRREIFETNVLGTRHVLDAARKAGVAKVVVTGSFSAVGHDPLRASDETVAFDPFQPVTPYETSKALVELECWRAAAGGLPVVVAVSCAIIGPFDFKPSRMGRVLVDFARGRLRAYIPGGFEFVTASDIAEGHRLAMERGRSGEKYIFSSEYLTVDDLMSIFENVTGRPRPRWRLPPAVMAAWANGFAAVTGVLFPRWEPRFTPGAVRLLRMGRHADTRKARSELGYAPTRVADAVQEAYAWFRERGEIA
jgi:nucleoside-diphosphate-sugar epimerase